jgi:hypothetical protein
LFTSASHITSRPARAFAWAAVGYVACAVVFSWPLVAHLGTALTGSPTGDTGVYVWNLWVFQHELLHQHSPYFTNTLFGPHLVANLSLHNYTTFHDLLALPLMGALGVVTTFNVVYLVTVVMTAYAAFLLAYRVTGAAPEAWLAGALFAWSPFLVTRGMGHFSLVDAAPLAVFLLLIERAVARPRMLDAVALGATMWWAWSTDAYYAVYCLILGAVFVVARVLVVERDPARRHPLALRRGLDVLMLLLAGVILAILVTGGWETTLLGQPLRMRTVYNPVLALTVLTLVRVAWHYRTSLHRFSSREIWTFARLAAVTGTVTFVLMLPVLYAVGVRVAEGRADLPKTLWRSSPPGVDLLALVLPNPNHPLAPAAIANWLAARPNGYLENVASIPWVAIALLAFAWWRGWKAPRWWAGLALFFGLLALGPFVVIGGINTHVPGPWALLRYVPLVGLARTPARFAVLLVLAVSVLVASALAWLGAAYPSRRRPILLVFGALLFAELLPAPLQLYSAAVPRIYERIAADPDDVTVLELPFGIRDGASSVGNFTARTEYFQTAHGKTILGGYLSRVSRESVAQMRQVPSIDALLVLSEDKPLSPAQEAAFRADAPSFLSREHVRYVVVDRTRSPASLVAESVAAFHLTLVDRDGPMELYRPEVH